MERQEDAYRKSAGRSGSGPGEDPGSNNGRNDPGGPLELGQAGEGDVEQERLQETEKLDPELEEMHRLIRERAEMERRVSELEEPERTLLRLEMAERVSELQEIEEAERQQLVKDALGKFGVFMHLTAFMAGVAYLVLLAVFVPKSVPWVFIPIGLWTVGIGYHFWRAWHPKESEDEALESLEDQEESADGRERHGGKRRRRAR